MHKNMRNRQGINITAGLAAATLTLLTGCSSVSSVSAYLNDATKPSATAATAGAGDARLPAFPGPGQEVYRGRFSYVRLVPSESGALTTAPLLLEEERVRTLLKDLLGGPEASFSDRPLFARSEVDELAGPLKTALANARPGEDIVFAVSGTHKPLSLSETESVTTGRLFVADGRLNLILGMTRVNFGDALQAQGTLRHFDEPGRQAALKTAEAVRGSLWQTVTSSRADWLGVPLENLGVQAAALPPASAASTAIPTTPTVSSASGGRRATALPSPAGESPGQDSSPPAERRLTTLERLRQKGLITQEEFDAKRRAVLDGL